MHLSVCRLLSVACLMSCQQLRSSGDKNTSAQPDLVDVLQCVADYWAVLVK